MSFNLAINVFEHPNQYRVFQKHIFEENKVIPDEIWHSLEEDAPWESFPPEYSKTLKQDKQA